MVSYYYFLASLIICVSIIVYRIHFHKHSTRELTMNANDLAKDICEQEIDDHENNIGQVKQLMRILADNIAVRPEAAKAWKKYVDNRRRKLLNGRKK